MNQEMFDAVKSRPGFIAALDQSGGSSPKALKLYGIDESEYSGDDEMFDRMHAMRTRIITSPSFNGDRVLGAILFEGTMDREIEGKGSAEYLWDVEAGRPVPEGRQGSRRRGRRRAGDEADAGPRRAARPRGGQGRVRHEDALGHQAREPGWREVDRRPAVRGRPPDPRPRPRPDHRARGRHPLAREGAGGGAPQGRDPRAARRAGRRPVGDAEAHAARDRRLLRRLHRAPALPQGRRAVRRLLA